MDKNQLKEAVGELNLVDTVFESDGVSYIDTAVSVTQVYDLIDRLEEPEKAEPLVVPKELGEWLCCQKLGNEGSFFSIIIELEDMWLGCGFEEFITDNKKQLIEVVIGNRDYEIEKEKLYYVSFPKPDLGYINMWRNTDTGSYYFAKSSSVTSQDGYKCVFTEKEINEHDERFWPFAVEVAE